MSNQIEVPEKANTNPVPASPRTAIQAAKSTFKDQFGTKALQIFKKEAGFALMAVSKNDLLGQCSPKSLTIAVANVALTDLSLNPTLGLAYLVPRKNKGVWEATLVPSYMGMIEILRKAGSVASIYADIIYDSDSFDYKQGTTPYLDHVPTLNRSSDSKPVAAYAVATFKDGRNRKEFHLMDWNAIMKRKAVATTKAVWDKWQDDMAKKTVIRSFYKLLPKTREANDAMAIFDEGIGEIDDQAQEPEVSQTPEFL